jgi:hypothetical protein
MKPTRIILHCSATEDGATVSWGAIRRYHVAERGWADIGYHFGIELVDSRFEILMGRIPDVPGAHAQGHNADSIGICFVGNFDHRPVPPEQWRLGLALTRWLCALHRIPPERVFGHREFQPAKTCPGLMFALDRFRADLSA